MAELRFEGATDGIRDVQLDFIRNVLEKRGFKTNRVVFEPVGQSGDNYVANVSRITVVVEDGEDFKVIAKIAPDNEILRQTMNSANLFNNESIMYQEVLPKFTSLQLSAGVAEKDLLKYAECYGCFTEPPNEVILLEDLKETGYGMLDRFSSLTNDAVRLILKNFALIHSLSYALKKKEPETYKKFKTNLFDSMRYMIHTEEFKYYTAKLEEDALTKVDDEKYKSALRGVVSQMTVFIADLKKKELESKHVVLVQGDSWTNNIMFKLSGDVPTKCIMIDYQLSREANPVCDFLYMIFGCTDHNMRSKYYHNWVDYYHDQLDKALSDFGMKASLVYSRDQFDADLRRYSKMYFAFSVMFYGIICRKPEEADQIKELMKESDKMNSSMLEDLSQQTSEMYKSRVEGLIDSYRLFGYI